MATTYEFVVETLDFYPGCGDDPDIIDTVPLTTLPEAAAFAAECEEPWRVCLRRDSGDDVGGLKDRFYAYPDATGKLPSQMETATGFADGPDVPKRFLEMTFPVDGRKSA